MSFRRASVIFGIVTSDITNNRPIFFANHIVHTLFSYATHICSEKGQQQRHYLVVVNGANIRRNIKNPVLLHALSLLPLLQVLHMPYILDDKNWWRSLPIDTSTSPALSTRTKSLKKRKNNTPENHEIDTTATES
jgi:hypothetical protein